MASHRLLLAALLAGLMLVAALASRAAAKSTLLTSHVVREPLVTARPAAAILDPQFRAATTTELTEEYDDDDVGVGALGGAYELPSAEDDTSSSTSTETVAPTARPTLSNAAPPNHVTRPKTQTVPSAPTTTVRTTTPSTTTSTTTTTTTTTTKRPATLPPAPPVRPKSPPTTFSVGGGPTQSRSDDSACPRREDIHPCQCIEIPSRIPGDVETVATCKNIRNQQVLSDALKGFQHYRINFFVLDSCKLPPFPNGLFHNVNVEWMEVLNSTVQFQKSFFTCSKDCL